MFGNEAGRVLRLGPMGEVVWTAELAHEVRLTPTVVQDTVVAASTGTDAAGFDAQTGARRWRLDLPRPAAALAGLGKTAYVLTEDGELVALEARTGALQTRTAFGTALGLHPPAPARLSLAVAPGRGFWLPGQPPFSPSVQTEDGAGEPPSKAPWDSSSRTDSSSPSTRAVRCWRSTSKRAGCAGSERWAPGPLRLPRTL